MTGTSVTLQHWDLQERHRETVCLEV